MVEATIEDPTQPNQAFFTGCSSRVSIWGHPHIVGEDVLSTTKIFKCLLLSESGSFGRGIAFRICKLSRPGG